MTAAARREANALYFLLALSLLVGVVLRIIHLDAQSFWYDEAFSWDRSTLPFPQMIAALAADFNKPPLHYFFLRGWLDLAGNNSLTARLLMALFGIATLPAMYWLGRELYDRTTATIGVALLAISELAVAYSQEVRPYSQLMFFTVTATAFYVRAIERRSLAAWIGASLCGVLALWTHYYAIFAIVAIAVWHMVNARTRLPFVWIALALTLGAASFVPWLLSGVVDAALNSSDTIKLNQPSYFSVGWDTPFENLVAFGNGRLDSVIARAGAPWAIIVSSALFCAPVLLMLRRRWERGLLAMGLVVAFGALSASWKWVLVATVLVVACGWIETIDNPRRRQFATAAFLIAVLAAAAVAQMQYVPYFFVFLLGILVASPLRQWLPELGTMDNDWRRTSLLAFMVALPLVVLPLAGVLGVQYDVRYALAALAPFYLLVARAIALFTRPGLRYAWLLAIVVFSIMGIRTELMVPYKENYRDALAFLHDKYERGDCVAFVPTWTVPLQWHLYRYDDVAIRNLGESELNGGGAGCRDLWLVTYERVSHTAARGRAVETQLSERRNIVDGHQYHWVRVMHFGPVKN